MSEKQYDNEMRFTLFENNKGDNPKRPDRKGTLTMHGVEYTISGWIQTGKSGTRFLSGKVEPKKNGGAPTKPASPIDDADVPKEQDDVPF